MPVTNPFNSGMSEASARIHLYGRFCRGRPSPSPWRPYHDPGLFEVARCGLAPHAHRFLDSPQRPAQTPEGYDLLFLFIAQDIAHMRRVPPSRSNQRPERGLYMAGFHVIIYGRFWVFTEVCVFHAGSIALRRSARTT